MIPQHENELYANLMMLSDNMMNNGGLSAYPLLQPVFMQMASNVQVIASSAMARMREEVFFGMTPWAKLYEMTTGRKIEVPSRTIVKNLISEQWVAVAQRPMDEIVDYYMKYRGCDEKEMVFNHIHDRIVLDLATRQTVFHWHENDMRMIVLNMGQSRAVLNCPLFHEPYQIDADMTYLHQVLFDPLYERIVGKEHFDPIDEKNILTHHYFGSGGPSDVPDTHPIRQLTELLMHYGYLGHSHTVTFVLNGHTFTMGAVRDYSFDSYIESVPRIINVQRKVVNDDTEQMVEVRSWYLNPLLVRDLWSNIDRIVDELLTKHSIEKDK